MNSQIKTTLSIADRVGKLTNKHIIDINLTCSAYSCALLRNRTATSRMLYQDVLLQGLLGVSAFTSSTPIKVKTH